MSLLFLATFFVFNTQSQTICRSGMCFANPRSGATVICTNEFRTCIITCNRPNQCRGITLYSGSAETVIQCINKDSCKDATFYIGTQTTQTKLPSTVSISKFEGDKISLMMNCNKAQSCKNIKVTVNGNYANGILINSMNDNSFNNASLYCNLGSDSETCQLNCGSQYQTSCLQSYYNCPNGKCTCTGNTCPIILTPKPTQMPTISPTTEPTLEPTTKVPTNIPTSTPTLNPTFNDTISFWDKTIFKPWFYALIFIFIIMFVIFLIYLCCKVKNGNKKPKFNPYSKRVIMVQKTDQNKQKETNPYKYESTNDTKKNMKIYLLGGKQKYNTFKNFGTSNSNSNLNGEEEIKDHNSTLEMEDVSELYCD